MNEDKSTRYRRLRRRGRFISAAFVACVLTSFVLETGGTWLRLAAARATLWLDVPDVWHRLCTALVGALLLALMLIVAAAPGAFYVTSWLDRRYGLSRQSIGAWAREHIASSMLVLAGALGWALVVYGAMELSPTWWWLLAAAGLTIMSALLALGAPLLLFPYFYGTRPVSGALAERIEALTARARVSIGGVNELAVGDGHRWANALLVGLGPTRRILLADSLVERLTTDELEVVVAHELGHHVHGDVWKGLLIDSLQTLSTLLIAAAGLRWLGPELGMMQPSDVAAMPLLVLLLGAGRVITTPPFLAALRAHERRADEFALELTGNALAFESVMRRLADRNMVDASSARMWDALFHSHPSVEQRIALARGWAAIARSANGVGDGSYLRRS